MYNYEHELKTIKDINLRNYIFYDYFHDSIITKISITNEGKLVELDLSCEREWPSHNWKDYAEDKNYLYKLQFINCSHIEYDRNDIGTYAEYINGRFKDSALLRKIANESRKTYYHLRIQFADGYIDLIFNKFNLEKPANNNKSQKRISIDWHFDKIKNEFSKLNIEEVRDIAYKGEFPKRSYALEYLWIIKDEKTLDLAVHSLTDEDARIPGVFIIGEIGNFNCIEYLIKLLSKNDYNSIFKRNINDALEKIYVKVGQNDFS